MRSVRFSQSTFAIASFGTALFLLFVWEAFATPNVVFFFSKPSEILWAFKEAVLSGRALTDSWASFAATLLGITVGIILGVVIGTAGLLSEVARPTIFAVISAIAAFPILALAPMFLIWFGTGFTLKASLAATLATLVAANATLRAPDLAGAELLSFSVANQWSKQLLLRKILIPLGAREVLRRLPEASNAAFLGTFVGEFIAADRGVGYRILRSGSLYQIDVVLAYAMLAVIVLLSLQLLVWIARSQIQNAIELLSIDAAIRRERLRS